MVGGNNATFMTKEFRQGIINRCRMKTKYRGPCRGPILILFLS